MTLRNLPDGPVYLVGDWIGTVHVLAYVGSNLVERDLVRAGVEPLRQALGLIFTKPTVRFASTNRALSYVKEPLISFVRTNVAVRNDGIEFQVFNAEGGDLVFVQPRLLAYIDDPETLWGFSADSPLINAECVEEATGIVMPGTSSTLSRLLGGSTPDELTERVAAAGRGS